jgi:hypothetical protein
MKGIRKWKRLQDSLQGGGGVCQMGQMAVVVLCAPTKSMSLLSIICAIQQVCDVDDGG